MNRPPAVIAFCDLDDSLVQSAGKLGRTGESGSDDIVLFSSRGKPITVQTLSQRAFYQWLSNTTRFIPTTGRSSKWLGLLDLEFNDYAICTFGGVILTPSLEPEPRWLELMSTESKQSSSTFTQLVELCSAEVRRLEIDARVNVVSDLGIALYVSIKHFHSNSQKMVLFSRFLESQLPAGWRLQIDGPSCAALPPFLGKDKAVSWFLQELAGPQDLILGLGDRNSDLPYMSLADFAIIPLPSCISSSL